MIYRLGMIGLWDHTSYTLGALSSMKNVKLVACACTESSLLESHRAQYPFFNDSVKVYTNFHDMLARESLDIVAVYTTHGERPEAIVAAANAGAHIYSEKPLCTSLKDLERIKQAIAQNGIKLTMMLSMRFEGIYRKAREIVSQGGIGEIVIATSQKSYKLGNRPEWMKNRGTYAGTIPYIGCHSLDLMRWITELEFIQGAAFQNTVGFPELGCMENSASMILLASNGATISARLDYCRPWNVTGWGDDRLRIAGLEGILEILNNKITLMTNRKDTVEIPPSESISQFENFMAAIEGREYLLIPANDCYRITEVVLKLRDAADAGVMTLL